MQLSGILLHLSHTAKHCFTVFTVSFFTRIRRLDTETVEVKGNKCSEYFKNTNSIEDELKDADLYNVNAVNS